MSLLDFTEALITQNSLDIDLDLRTGGNLHIITKPGILVDPDGITLSRGDIKIRPTTDPTAPTTLHIRLTGQARGDVIARPSRRPITALRGKQRSIENRD